MREVHRTHEHARAEGVALSKNAYDVMPKHAFTATPEHEWGASNSEAADRYLDLAAGRPLMTARLAPLGDGSGATAMTATAAATAAAARQHLGHQLERAHRASAEGFRAAQDRTSDRSVGGRKKK